MNILITVGIALKQSVQLAYFIPHSDIGTVITVDFFIFCLFLIQG